MKVDIVKLTDDFAYVIVEGSTVGKVARYIDGFKFGMESYIENVFCPKHVAEIRRVGNEAAVVMSVTTRLKGKP